VTVARRVGVFGGTFDPIHIGHLAAAQDAAETLRLDRVFFVPNGRPPHKQSPAVSEVTDRVAMVRSAIADNPLFALSLIEVERPGMSYLLDTLRQFRKELQTGTEMYCLVGCDGLRDLHTWHLPERLLAEFQLVVLDRPSAHAVDWASIEQHFPDIRRQILMVHVVQLQISSEEIRARVAEARSIRYYVPDSVYAYIQQRGLYRAES